MPSLRWSSNVYNEEFFTNTTDLGEFFHVLLMWAPKEHQGYIHLDVFERDQWNVIWVREKFTIQDLFDSRDRILQRIRWGYSGFTNPCGEIFLGEPEVDVLTTEAARVHAMNPIEQSEYWRAAFERASKYLDRTDSVK